MTGAGTAVARCHWRNRMIVMVHFHCLFDIINTNICYLSKIWFIVVFHKAIFTTLDPHVVLSSFVITRRLLKCSNTFIG